MLFTDQAEVVARYAPWVYAPDPAELATTVMIDEGQDVTLGVTQLEEEVRNSIGQRICSRRSARYAPGLQAFCQL